MADPAMERYDPPSDYYLCGNKKGERMERKKKRKEESSRKLTHGEKIRLFLPLADAVTCLANNDNNNPIILLTNHRCHVGRGRIAAYVT